MVQFHEGVGVDFPPVFAKRFAKVVVLRQQSAAGVDAGSEELVSQWLLVLAVWLDERRHPIGRDVRLEMLKHTPLDEHEASAAVAHLDDTARVGLNVLLVHHVEHEGTAVVL